MTKQLARNTDMVIAAESMKQMFDEMVTAGFTEEQALTYLSSLMAKTLREVQKEKEKQE